MPAENAPRAELRARLFIKDPTAGAMIAFFLESQFNAEVQYGAPKEGEPAAELLICDPEAVALDVPKTFPETPVVLGIGASGAAKPAAEATPALALIHPENLLPELEAHLQSAVQKGRLPRVDATRVGFCRIRTTLLARVSPLKADIYIRLSEVKYVKLFRQGDVFDSKDLERYAVQKKQEYLYLRKAETAEFIEKFRRDLDLLLRSAALQPKQAGDVARTVHETIRELGNGIGFTPQVQEMARQGVKMAITAIGSSPRLSDLYQHLTRDKEKYLSSHSLAVAHVACAIAMASDWPSETTFQKLTFAGYFHDIVFTNQALCRIPDLAELERKKDQFTPEEIKHYKSHPLTVSDMMKKFREIPPDVDVIILQHHEKADGTGFPKRLQAAYISPLASIFIVAHDLVDFLFDHPDAGPAEVGAFLADYKTHSGFGTFKRILNAVEKAGLIQSLGQKAR